MGILEIGGDVFNYQKDRGTQVTFIGCKSEMPNVLKWEKGSCTTKNCPAPRMALEFRTEHLYRHTKPVYNFLSGN